MGVTLGALALGAVSVVMLLSPERLWGGVLLFVPVAVLSWFGGVWTGRLGVGLGVVACMLAGLGTSGVVDGVVLANAGLTAAVLIVIAETVPGLRLGSQGYREHAQTDPLTSLGNRRFFREVALVELNRSRRYSRAVSLVYLDVDGFERMRRESGHAECDLLLVQIASVMTGTLRSSDVVARISGAEFAVLLPETDGPGAQVVADKLRTRLEATISSSGIRFHAAVVGVSEGPVSLEAMLRQADEAMLDAKRSGTLETGYRAYVHPPMQLV